VVNIQIYDDNLVNRFSKKWTVILPKSNRFFYCKSRTN